MLEREKRQLYLAAETVREIGILVAVFAPLDAYFHDEPPATWEITVLVLGALTAILVAISIESEREGWMDHYPARWLPALAVAAILLAYAAYLRWKIRRAEGGQSQMRLTYTTTTSMMGWPSTLFRRSDRERKAS